MTRARRGHRHPAKPAQHGGHGVSHGNRLQLLVGIRNRHHVASAYQIIAEDLVVASGDCKLLEACAALGNGPTATPAYADCGTKPKPSSDGGGLKVNPP